jgi:hypothetical protein
MEIRLMLCAPIRLTLTFIHISLFHVCFGVFSHGFLKFFSSFSTKDINPHRAFASGNS